MSARPAAGTLRSDARRRFAQHEQYLAKHEPRLQLVLDEGVATAQIIGAIAVPLGAGRSEPFEVLICYASTEKGINPFLSPETYDPAGRFPRDADRHVEGDGRFCMWLPHTDPRDFDQPDGLARHLERIREFITLQITCEDRIARDITPHWPGQEWGHGDEGYREWVRQHVDGLTTSQVARFALALDSPPFPRMPCPCGGRRKLADCHRQWFQALRAAAHQRKNTVWQELHQIVMAKNAVELTPTSPPGASTDPDPDPGNAG
ncbi:hypothetical protein OG218_26435 [Kineococcus sp. NBC_00420]|uniref:hypothetical protein n=1 Tax=Kineococcus sp. NBC_00420 TaxID=2903564 RepID=UPI002E1BCD88